MKKLVKFRLGLCAIELVFCILLLCMEAGIQRRFPYAGVAEIVTYGGFTIILTARIINTLFMAELVPNYIDLTWTRTGMVLYTVSGWVQVVERQDLNRASVGFGCALIFLFDQTVFYLNHPVPEHYLHTLEPPPRRTADSKALLDQRGSCVRRAAVS